MTTATPLDLTNPGDIFLYRTFHYRPDTWGNSIEVIQFSLATLTIAWLNFHFSRKTGNPAWYMHLITLTGLMEVVGYVLRIETVKTLNLTCFITTTAGILVAPILLAGVNYVVIGKLLKASNKSILCIKPRHATCFFVTADVLCFFIQCSSAALLTSKDSSLQSAGTDVVLFGLSLQLFFFSCFVLIAFYLAYSKKFRMISIPELRPVFKGLLFTSIFLYIRNVFRFVEFASGRDSQIVKYEMVFFFFETSPILASFVLYCIYHFGYLLPGEDALSTLLSKNPPEPTVEAEMADVEMQQI